MENRRTGGVLNPVRNKNRRQEPGGKRDDTCAHGLSRSWEVEAFFLKQDECRSYTINTTIIVISVSACYANAKKKRSMSAVSPINLG